jgi:hypothetical protein
VQNKCLTSPKNRLYYRPDRIPEKSISKQIWGGKKMEPNAMLKQMLDFNKSAFDNSFSAMLTIQEQNAKMVNTFLEQAAWIPEEGKKLIRNWVDAYKKGYEDFKKTADENYKKVDEFFASTKS